MPEIVDLEIFKKNLEKRFKNKKLQKVEIGSGAKIEASEKDFEKALSGKKLKSVDRKAKELYFNFGDDQVVSMHLMLHGQLSTPETLPKAFVAAFLFEGTEPLVLSDYQKAAKISLNPKENMVVDALSDEMTPEWLEAQLKKRRSPVKTVICDPKIIGGIGNAYADEILWEAKIHPESIANQIPAKEVHKLAKAIKSVVNDSIEKIRESNPDIISGEIRDFMVVHNHKRKTSPTGGQIKNATVGSRKTYYTDEQIKY
ncbi:Formamidopyrimidine-DNA glycosylase [Dyadobacter sp. CECT 9623]|uniref:Formamidopyrimidine-DNA glycosylase n=1 Tax=Dyadobacter linearis TaxID=2823330 RepID=A0ABM8ULH8_9BACT|nr:DNA-formamidopyrimidine glycosylase family protein [Dyadobacter sp. CECT 9623]CAG5068175.1 Formamidopyrimidine-DNA glycosylase [Dyadobacter sp. CECT 9623]